DGSVIAQLGVTDMAIPILYALTYPARRPCPVPSLDLARVGQLTFSEPDTRKFPCLTLARRALSQGGAASVVLNAANEVAVAAFLEDRIRFTQISELIAEALERELAREPGSIEECVAIDGETRRFVREQLLGQPASAGSGRSG
ncbi:MAG: 1-deoxy-D-xylulose-5-phosphate reductoisomerase, partial [Candidatus Rokubacteria bacterium]|nr:1-deoxy-D-xylulose-5-phosphate reductoisomerase [Candidatus Rokubacteria bacterium]